MHNKELGKIESAEIFHEDRDYWTCHIGIHFKGFYQVFGGLCLDLGQAQTFGRAVCDLFGVNYTGAYSIKDLVGKECYGLWSLAWNNESMEGIETLDGNRFTISGFRNKHFPDKFNSAFDEKIKSIQGTISWAERRLNEAKQDLERCRREWVDWESKLI